MLIYVLIVNYDRKFWDAIFRAWRNVIGLDVFELISIL